jgi:hypothetical protein
MNRTLLKAGRTPASPNSASMRPLRATLAVLVVLGGPAGFLDSDRTRAAGAPPISGRLLGLSPPPAGDANGRVWLTVGRERVVVPADAPIDLPAGRKTTFARLFADAPEPCRERRESGLAAVDTCAAVIGLMEGAHVTVTPSDPDLAHTPQILIERTRESVMGDVNFVSHGEGYVRLNGRHGRDEGMLLRINDPLAAISVQQGRACGLEGNCSPDARFGINILEPSARFTVGLPACLPSIGAADALCPGARRRISSSIDGNGPMPIEAGDHLNALGSSVSISGVRVFSAHTVLIGEAMAIR